MSKALPWIKIGVSVSLLGLVALLLDWQESKSLLGGTAKSDLALGLGLLLCAYLVNGIRLIRLQQRVDLKMPAPLFWGSLYTGLLFNYVLPSGVGGDAVRVLFLARRGYPMSALVISGLVDRFFGLLGLFGLGGLAILAVPSVLPIKPDFSLILGLGLLLGTAIGLWWLPRLSFSLLSRLGSRVKGHWGTKIEGGSLHVQRIFDKPGRLLGPFSLSLLSHVLVILSYASCGQSLLPEISLAHYFVAIPGVMLILTIPISLGGLGLREVSTVGLLVWMGADPQAALTLSLVFLAVSWISVIPGVFTAVHYGFRSFTPEDQTHAS